MRSWRTEFILTITLPLLAGCAGLQPEPRFRDRANPPAATTRAVRITNWQRDLALELRRYLGAPYVWGGASPDGVDCSGLVVAVYGATLGLELPHSVTGLLRAGKPVAAQAVQVGDLLFFQTRGGPAPDHVGIYVGGGRFVHASRGNGVVVSSLRDPYYARRWIATRRIVPPERGRISAGDHR